MEKNSKLKLMDLIRVSSVEVFNGSTFHGVPNIIRTKHLPVKTMWTILILISIGTSSYFTITGLTEYLEFSTRSNIFSKTEDYNTLPALTFCSTMFFAKWKESRPIVYKFLENKTGKKITGESDFVELIDSVELTDLANFYTQLGMLLKTGWVNDSTVRSISFNKSEFVLECTFNGVSCNLESVIWYFNTYYGKIYPFYLTFFFR
jgi:hypothetical protein